MMSGVVTTRFWRAPKILPLKVREGIAEAKKFMTHAIDVYSFAMTSYEVITGLIDLEGHRLFMSMVVEGLIG
ncbi:hypothetical protein M758_1G266000 [Ceratodon purpureus]|uniref:Protein kinase domain-containing protein n=1 Tax=Ceratodon purpureus TaxID=3225 RepID=A0A8T0JAC1_CERPU|nr:hypothetical protein KC19_1G273800 [Ceratodon purpureus]KAG0631607.1 hypothetical protein M758_1G266000 [Ceratodon purpureus]